MEYNIPQNLNVDKKINPNILTWILHIGLFLATFFSVTIAGVLWQGKDPFDLTNFYIGIPYSISILFILLCHEMGHYIASRIHKVDVTLPYFLPFPPIPFLMQLFLNFGTFGAVIKTKSIIQSKKHMFDIGVAGPIAGFFASVIVLIYGFINLPSSEFILSIHPNYQFLSETVHSNGQTLTFGSTLLYGWLQNIFTNPQVQFVPPMSEMYHYPFLCAGWFGLFVTALNLIPIGQFDGGHVVYSMFGNHHKKIATISLYVIMLLSIPSIANTLLQILFEIFEQRTIGDVIPFVEYSWSAWFVWAIIALYIVKINHPKVPDETPLDNRRQLIGWFAIFIFIVSFSLVPISII